MNKNKNTDKITRVHKLSEKKNFTFNFYYDEEFQSFCDYIKKNIFEDNGMIFGSYVRDYILRNHHQKEFLKKYNRSDLYNEKVDKKSFMARTMMTSTNIDVFFCDYEKYEAFKENLESNNWFEVDEKLNHTLNMYIKIQTLCLTKTVFLCNTVFQFKVHLKIYYYENGTLLDNPFEPPFNRLDFLTNVFIMTRNHMRISNNTGTYLDKLSPEDKYLEQMKIYNDVINQKYVIAKQVGNHPSIIKKIAELLYYDQNVVSFDFFKETTEKEKNEERCMICYHDSGDGCVKYKFNTCFYCRNCFFEYLNKLEANKQGDLDDESVLLDDKSTESKKERKLYYITDPYKNKFVI
jgi:hypothetical protein